MFKLLFGGLGVQGYLSVNFSDNYYIGSQRFAEVPRLTKAQFEAMDLFNELAGSEELKITYMLQPGDIQLLSNHTVLHHRGAFRDGPVSTSVGRWLLNPVTVVLGDKCGHIFRLWALYTPRLLLLSFSAREAL